MVKDPTELIHCDNCGEDYAAAYRRCPFCNAKPGKKPPKAPPVYDEFDEDLLLEEDTGEMDTAPLYEEDEDDFAQSYASPAYGGKRLVTNRRGGGYGGGVSVGRVVGYILTALIVAAAIWAVITQLLPRLLPAGGSVDPTPTPSAPVETPVTTPSTPAAVVTPEAPDGGDDYSEPLPEVSGMPDTSEPTVSASPSTSPAASAAPAASSAPSGDSLQLSSEDFTLSQRYPTYQMEISGVGRAQATYVMADENVASVNSTGYVTAKKNGVTKLTVTATDGRTATAIVRVSGFAAASEPSASTSPAPAESTAPSGEAKLSSTDFTLSSTNGKSYRLTVSGGTASYWTSSNEGVATVSANGTVTAVSRGTAKITCGLTDGSILTCIVRVS